MLFEWIQNKRSIETIEIGKQYKYSKIMSLWFKKDQWKSTWISPSKYHEQ
jgi:hypothetical protein